ncbi:hypothetical protein [Haloarchaeobius litoreus]|uniref:Uncharacterized protein n=1 Tax=Haloarchaeobius litoreus TaxID=755306 RepID=A0ABD6DF23_9EURY|nr:hypothetical protein [Haloarchaeobius litoreus]
METTHLVIFGPVNDEVNETADQIRTLCERKGVEYQGPHTFEVIKDWTPDRDDEPPYVINGREMAKEEVEPLLNRSIYTRKFEFYRYGSDDVVKQLSFRDYPESIFVSIAVNQSEFQGWNQGYAPHTYDPATDYKTDP